MRNRGARTYRSQPLASRGIALITSCTTAIRGKAHTSFAGGVDTPGLGHSALALLQDIDNVAPHDSAPHLGFLFLSEK